MKIEVLTCSYTRTLDIFNAVADTHVIPTWYQRDTCLNTLENIENRKNWMASSMIHLMKTEIGRRKHNIRELKQTRTGSQKTAFILWSDKKSMARG